MDICVTISRSGSFSQAVTVVLKQPDLSVPWDILVGWPRTLKSDFNILTNKMYFLSRNQFYLSELLLLSIPFPVLQIYAGPVEIHGCQTECLEDYRIVSKALLWDNIFHLQLFKMTNTCSLRGTFLPRKKSHFSIFPLLRLIRRKPCAQVMRSGTFIVGKTLNWKTYKYLGRLGQPVRNAFPF